MGQEGEEGEEEAMRTIDPCVDPDAASRAASGTRYITPAPVIAMGTLKSGPAATAASKPRAKKKAEPQEDDDLAIVQVENSVEEVDETYKDIMTVPRLKLIVNSTGVVAPSFLGLVPQRVLNAKERPGKQLRGVWGLKNARQWCSGIVVCRCHRHGMTLRD